MFFDWSTIRKLIWLRAAGIIGAVWKTITNVALATFTAVASPVRALTIDIDPVQDLHGYDNPWPAGGGVNQYSGNDETYSYPYQGYQVITYSKKPDTTYTVAFVSNKSGFNIWTIDATASVGGAVVEGLNIFTFTTPSSLAIENKMFYITTAVSDVITFSKIFVAEGTIAPADYTYSPYSNICPISGWTGANVTRTGKNLLKNIVYLSNSALIMLGQTEQYWNAQKTYLKAGTYSYSLYSNVAGGAAMYYGTTTPLGYVSLAAGKNTLIINIPKDGYYAFWIYGSDLDVSDYSEAQVELGNQATAYEAYSGTTIPVSWQTEAGTVYGGTLDVTTGVLTATWAAKAFTGTENWQMHGAIQSWFYLDNSITDAALDKDKNDFAISNAYVQREYQNAVSVVNGEFALGVIGEEKRLVVKNTAYATANDFKTALENQNLQVVYELATPQTYQLTPAEVTTLLGQNNVWADTGNINTLTYRDR